ncbi:hypothetical protein [Desulfocurvus vexinensis]|uniref:hypothetical protein n=1 Tax=Desulfocurvus vexinensis TaxID=399548 RepID=UPI00146FC573|nr:hypothetical protein [Desulfocurvus vexinensis]
MTLTVLRPHGPGGAVRAACPFLGACAAPRGPYCRDRTRARLCLRHLALRKGRGWPEPVPAPA